MATRGGGLSEDVSKWMDDLDSSQLYPPGKDLTTSDNFFNVDETLNALDTEKLESVAQQWKSEAHKKMKKKNREAKEIKIEEMAPTIGGTVLSERRPAFSKMLPAAERSLPNLVPEREKERSTTSLPSQSDIPRARFITSPPDISTIEEVTDQRTAAATQQLPTWHVPSIKQTINRILVDQPYVLEWYKSVDEKKALLREAIDTHDGNTIITIVLFLRSSLSKAWFETLLINHIEAAQHYCSFLRQNAAWEQLKTVYYVLGEYRHLMLQYQLALSHEAIPARINALDRCCGLLKNKPAMQKEHYYVEQYVKLLRRQQKMEVIREALPPAAIKRFQSVPLIDANLITSLMYCCRFHLNDQDLIVNPEDFKKEFDISEKQYFIVLLGALCAKRDWPYIEKLLTPKGWQTKLGLGSKIKAPISLERIIRIIGKKSYLAEEDFLSKYIRQVDDLETRLELATKYQCYGLGIEVIKQLKDNERLKTYFNDIPVEKQRKYRPSIVKLFS